MTIMESESNGEMESAIQTGSSSGDLSWLVPTGSHPAVSELKMRNTTYCDFLKTMLAEKLDKDDPIFQSANRKELEEECLSLGMSLPLVRVVDDVIDL